MSVQNGPLPSRRKASAIVSRATLDRQRGVFERMMAIGLLLLSFAGTAAALSGGWSVLLADPQPGRIAAGIAAQLALTAAEWWYGNGRGRWRYRVALCLDTALTALGYGPLIVPPLAAYLAGRGLDSGANAAAWAIVALVSVALAWYPEKTLID